VKDVLFDADAFLCIRKLSFLRTLEAGKGKWLMTGYIAKHELSDVVAEIGALCAAERLQIHQLPARDVGFRRLKEQGHDRGEAEAIAWAAQLPRDQRPLFISVDKRARDGAKENGVPVGDILDLMIEAVDCGDVSYEDAREKASIWDDKHQVQGRPRDYTTFAETFEKRRQSRRQR
jgi:predicted nucleic acid-binding protein